MHSEIAMQIGAERRTGSTTFETIDPFTGRAWAVVPEATKADVDDAVAAARSALQGPWATMSGRERAALLRRLGELITEEADELAIAETQDNGKLLREMGGQVRGLPAWYDYYAGLADKIDGRVVDTGRADFFGYVQRGPVGVVAAILPWNSPLLLLTFKLAPALAAGCTIVAKPSEQAPVSILRLAELFERAGFPPGVFNTVSGQSREVGEWLVSHPDVDRVTFTGSEATGIAVARAAAGHFAPVTLELGGKSANIVFPDADLEAAANGLIAGIFAAAGQTCIAGSRALIHADVYEEVVARVADRAARIVMGDPKAEATEMGPICFPGQLEKIKRFVADAKESGADIVTGGSDGGLGGLFFQPTIVANVDNDNPICQDEIFGPVLSLLKFSSEEEALQIANSSRYGLAAGLWTKDVQRIFRMSKALNVGTVWVNAYRTLNWSMPFGGVKASGYGRENGTEGLHEFLQDKAVWIELTGNTRDPFVLGVNLPLDGVTVVSIEQAVAAPFATRQLADLGARVVKIERPGDGDFARGYDNTVMGLASYFVWLNRGKESLSLDLKDPAAADILDRLLGTADVFVQNLAPGAAARMGLSAARLRERDPRLVVCDLSGYGSSGPYADRRAYDLLVQSETGVLSVTGTPEQPAKVGISIADIAGGMNAYSAILSALLWRAQSGVGTALEVSLFDSLAEWMSQPMYYAMYTGVPPERTGTAHATIAPYGTFRCADGTVQLAIQNQREWARLCADVLGRPELTEQAAFAVNSARVANRAALTAAIEGALADVGAEEALRRLDAARIANGHFSSVADLLEHPQLERSWTSVDTPVGEVRALRPPARSDAWEPVMGAVPAVGQHTDALLAELGYPADQVGTWRAAGVL